MTEHELDARGLYCPEPIMLLHHRVRSLQAGERIRVLATDPAAKRDVDRFCRFLGHALIAAEEHGDQLSFLIEIGGAP
jgi:tRNA 2-thiouridine synthesizing protein A